MYDIGISEIAVTAKYEDTEDILKKPLPFSDILRIYKERVILKLPDYIILRDFLKDLTRMNSKAIFRQIDRQIR